MLEGKMQQKTYLKSTVQVMLFATVCVIPFALAQRNISKSSRDLVGVPTSTPTPTPGACQFQVLIVFADAVPPTQFQTEIQAEPNVTAVDLFDASNATPTLDQLQQYDIVVPFGNNMFFDSRMLGNNLADYVDGGGIVVQYGFSHAGPGDPAGINGRWLRDGYNPYDYSEDLETNPFSLGAFNAGHPLMAGVTTLNSTFANIVTPDPAATEVAQNNLGESLVAFRPVGTQTTIGVTAYVGSGATESGDWGKVVVNAGNWLLTCQASPTPTPTPSATPTATFTPTPSATPTPTPSATSTATPSPTPTATSRPAAANLPQFGSCPLFPGVAIVVPEFYFPHMARTATTFVRRADQGANKVFRPCHRVKSRTCGDPPHAQ
jgi:hypothetical protein